LPLDVVEHHRCHVASFGSARIPERAMEDRRMLKGQRADGSEFPIEVSIDKSNVDAFTASMKQMMGK